MTRRKQPTAGSVYQLRITLRESHPPVWRLVHVAADATLHKLHWVIQQAMGWTNSHLHQFIIGNERYAQTELFDDDHDFLGEHDVRLRDLLWRPESVFAYEYDFGDCWEHDLIIEAIHPRKKGERYPICTAGERACPPEDCGGVSGFEEMLVALGDPDHEEHDSFLRWLGGGFDPEAFDLADANRRLRPLWSRRSLDRAD